MTKSPNFIARQICLGKCRISINKQTPNKTWLPALQTTSGKFNSGISWHKLAQPAAKNRHRLACCLLQPRILCSNVITALCAKWLLYNTIKQIYRATNVYFGDFNTKISTNVRIDSPILTSQMISNTRITCKQQTGQSELRDSAINRQGIEMVSIWQIYYATRQKLCNLPCETGNFVAKQSCGTKLCNFVACLTWALYVLCQAVALENRKEG